MGNYQKLILAVLFLLSLTQLDAKAVDYNLHISPEGFKGQMFISSHDKDGFYLEKETTIIMHPNIDGVYYLYTGALELGCNNKQTSEIQISFDTKGNVVSICPAQSATIDPKDPKGIVLNTVAITIDPRNFSRDWEISTHQLPDYNYGKKTINLIVGQTYWIDNAHSSLTGSDGTGNPIYYGSYFYFTVDENGKVILYDKNKVSASSNDRTLTIKTVEIAIDPKEISGGLPLFIHKPFSQAYVINSKTTFRFIRGTANYVYWFTSSGKEMYYHFLPM